MSLSYLINASNGLCTITCVPSCLCLCSWPLSGAANSCFYSQIQLEGCKQPGVRLAFKGRLVCTLAFLTTCVLSTLRGEGSLVTHGAVVTPHYSSPCSPVAALYRHSNTKRKIFLMQRRMGKKKLQLRAEAIVCSLCMLVSLGPGVRMCL